MTLDPNLLISKPKRITLPASPAPSSKVLEKSYYPNENDIIESCKKIIKNE